MAGTQVESVVISSAGTGYTSNPTVSFSGGGGAGAAATASAYTGSFRPLSFFKGRFNDMYGVDGMGRGFRWNGESAAVQQIGIAAPAVGPAVTATSTSNAGLISAIQIVNGGRGYNNVPDVVFTGGTPATPAQATAVLSDGQVTKIKITSSGSGYQSTPVVNLSGGIGSGAAFNVGFVGSVAGVRITAVGTGYTSTHDNFPTVVFSNSQGLTQAVATVVVNEHGQIDNISLVSGGTGATTSGVTAVITGGGGSGAQVAVDMDYSVTAVTVANSGSGYYTPPTISFRADASNTVGSGAAATAVINSSGQVTGATVYLGGSYAAIPTALIADSSARATATLSQPMTGKYQCCIRYIDDTPEIANGPIPSSISDMVEIDAGTGSAVLTWTFDHTGIEDRVTAMELWRTSSDQAVVLYRVATIQRSDGAFTVPYADSLTDDQLQDTTRDGYGLMPVTLPSGQINARRFQVPPSNFAVACMFQDRAWYAVDTSGARPNSLLYSEIDEPESVPKENELVVQENTTDTDTIVALIPLGSELLIAQRAHMYKLNYVAQPVLDASLILGAYRGILNSRCWDVMGGVAFIADSNGFYGYDGSSEEPLSVPIDNYWRDKIIDFSKSDKFHVKADMTSRTVRFYYCQSADTDTVRALCYCLATKAWWEEQYPFAVTASCPVLLDGKYVSIHGTGDGKFVKPGGLVDADSSVVPYDMRTGAYQITDDNKSRSISVLYKPTTSDCQLNLRLHYNNSDTSKPNSVSSDRGGGFVAVQGSTAAILNMQKSLPLGDANGFARAYYSGHMDDRSLGADRNISVGLSGTQGTTTGDNVVLYGIAIEGVQ
jgi:hypothetical protein